MIKVLRLAAVSLLLFNGIGAIYGGWQLITDPNGSELQLSLHYLEHSPFSNYLIPGIVLFTFNGISSLVVAVFPVFKWHHYPALIFLQGCNLTGWLIIQMIMIQIIYFLHYILGAIGLLLMIAGIIISVKLKNIGNENRLRKHET